eukprot:12696475-Heterocapsa_arctica.AAC.1
MFGKERRSYPDRWSEERAGQLGATAGGIYLDISGFYDNIDLEKLFGKSLEMGFPRRVLLLS